MLLLPVVNEHLIEEKMELNEKGLYWNSHHCSKTYDLFEKRALFKIERFLGNDTYNVKIFPNVPRSTSGVYESPYININNEYEFMGRHSAINNGYEKISNQGDFWSVHHSLFKDVKFHKTSVIAVGSDVDAENLHADSAVYPWYRDVLYPKFSYLKSQDSISFNEVIHFRTIKGIEGQQVSKSNMNLFTKEYNGPVRFSNPDFQFKYIYNDVYIKPIKPRLGSTDKRVAQVFIKNSDNSPVTYDHNITNGILHSTSLGNNALETYFEESNDNIHYRDARLIGYISVANQTYYDYESGKTKEGFSAHSQEGDTVPYNYKGDFTRSITFGINGIFNKVTLAFSEKIETPLLDPFEGITKLHITYTDDPLEEVPQRFLDGDAIKKIREHNFSLVGINRISQIYAE